MQDEHIEADKARKERSPSFPFISLKRAVERLKEMADAHKRNQARMAVVGGTWGYAAKSSGLLQTVAALKAFGLIDDLGSGTDRKFQVSDLGWRILHDARPGARDGAIREAAVKPRLISEYASQWVPERPSDAHCLSELHLDRGFNEGAAKLFLKVFDETVAYANLVDNDALSASSEPAESKIIEAVGTATGVGRAVAYSERVSTSNEPIRLEILGRRIDVTARLETAEQVDELVRRLRIARALIAPLPADNPTED